MLVRRRLALLWLVAAGLLLAPDSALGQARLTPSAPVHPQIVIRNTKDCDNRPQPPECGCAWTQPASDGVTPIPDFGASPTRTATQDGNWSSTATWGGASVPGVGAIVNIPHARTVTYDANSATALKAVGINGRLNFSRSATTRLVTSEVVVYNDGMLDIGTTCEPMPVSVTATVEFSGTLDTGTAGAPGTDPSQFGVGLLALGTVRIHGRAKPVTWVRLSEEVSAGETDISIADGACPTGWQAGDRLILPESRHHRTEWPTLFGDDGWAHLEELTYTSCTGGVLTVSAPAYDHPGARNIDGTLVRYPHISNQTRNVILKSTNPSGVRGHTLYTERADVDIRYAAFNALGRTTIAPLDCTLRTTGAIQGIATSPACTEGTGTITHIGTNQIGRYPAHFHHLTGPSIPQVNGYQYTFIGNAVSDMARFKWGIAIHNSHFGYVGWNTMYDIWGAQLATEDGSETRNVIEYNSAIKGTGVCNGGVGSSCDGDPSEPGVGWVSAGRDGVGYWMRAGNNFFRHNIAANFYERDSYSAYGYKLYSRDIGTVTIPTTQGVPAMTAGTSVNGNQIPILQIEDNETYATSNAMTYWWICAADNLPYPSCTAGSIKDLMAWHFLTRGIYAYPSNGLTIDGYTAYGDTPSTQGGEGSAILAGDYQNRLWTITNAHIEGYRNGIYPTTVTDQGGFYGGTIPTFPNVITTGGTPMTIRNSYFRNTRDIWNGTLYTSSSCQQCIPPRITYLDNTVLAGTVNIDMDDIGTGNYTQMNKIVVTGYQGVVGDNFTVYYQESAPGATLLQAVGTDPTYSKYASPVSGQTNTYNWSTYGIAYAGEKATCATTRAGIENGYACVDTAIVSNLTAVHRAGQTFLTWTEIAGGGVTYSVYRSTSPITSLSGLTPIATGLTQDSGRLLHNDSAGANLTAGFVISDGGTPLASNKGLLVWTTATSGTYYYAVTNSTSSTLSSGSNTTPSGVAETHVTTPGWVRTATVTEVSGNDLHRQFAWEDYSTWKHTEWGYYGHAVDVRVKPSLTPATLYPLFLVSHPADGTGYMESLAYAPPYAYLTTQTSQGIYITPRDNYFPSADPYTGATRNTTFDIGNYSSTTDRVYTNTADRYRRYLMLVRDDAAFQADPNRIYCMGASRGGGGCMHFAAMNGDLIAAASVSIGWVDTQSGAIDFSPYVGELMIGGETYNHTADQTWLMANRSNIPPIMYWWGSDDFEPAYPTLLAAAATAKVFYAAQWAAIGHTTRYLGSQYSDSPMTAAPNLDVLRFKLNESYPAVTSASTDDSPGTPSSRTASGKINHYIDWQSSLRTVTGGSAITDTSTNYGISLISTGSSFTATVTIRNTLNFNPNSGQTVNWSMSTGGSGSVSANADGSVTITGRTIPTGSAARLSLSYP